MSEPRDEPITDAPEAEIDDEIITCWCGAKGTHDELFSDDLDDSCAGTGSLNCYCGGDQCVCHNHGETECPGCEDCDFGDDDLDIDLDDDPFTEET